MHGRHRRGLAVVAALFASLVASFAAAEARAATTVSLTFDDGRQTQYQALRLLKTHGLATTFYANSGEVSPWDGDWTMNWRQLHEFAAAANEIGGHSLHHPHLDRLT